MSKIIKIDDFFNELASLNKREVRLTMKREMAQSIEDLKSLSEKRCIVIHSLIYEDNEELRYAFEHRNISVGSLGEKTLARLLYKDLTKVLDKGEELKSKGIELLLAPNGVLLPYLGQKEYLSESKYLDVLLLPNLILSLKNRYKIKLSPV